MRSSYKSTQAANSYGSRNQPRQPRPSGSSSSPSAAWLAAEAAFSEIPAPNPTVQLPRAPIETPPAPVPVSTRAPRVFQVSRLATTAPEPAASPAQVAEPQPVRHRREARSTLSGPVTVLVSPTADVPAVEQSPTLSELLDELATMQAMIERLQQAPRPDFQVRPNQKAWHRLSQEADELLVTIRGADIKGRLARHRR